MLDDETLNSIAILMQNGFSLQETLGILRTRKNGKAFDEMTARLENGEEASVFLAAYCSRRVRRYLEGFLSVLPLPEALHASIVIMQDDAQVTGRLFKGLLYPCFLIGLIPPGVFLFSHVLMPQMNSLMASFQMETGGYETAAEILEVFAVILIIALLLLGAGFLMLKNRKILCAFYRFLSAHLPDSFPVQYASREFVRFFLECVRCGIPTIEAMDLIRRIPGKPLSSLIADDLDTAMKQGSSFRSAVEKGAMESSLMFFMKTAVYSSDCERVLKAYLEMVRLRTDRQVRVFSAAVQTVSYVCIGILILSVYRILLLPMNMLQQIG